MGADLLSASWLGTGKEKKMDRRSRRTRSALTAALMSLLAEKQLKDITVTELAERADVNRATFYAHYQDIYDMADQVKQETMLICSQLVEAHAQEVARGDFAELLTDMFEFAKENQGLFEVFLGTNGDGSFLRSLIDMVREKMFEMTHPIDRVVEHRADLADALDAEQAQKLYDYQFEYIAGGAVNMLRSWVGGGCEEPVSYMVKLSSTLIGSTTDNAFEQNLQMLATQPAQSV